MKTNVMFDHKSPLAKLGEGEINLRFYQAEFDQLYRTDEIRDRWGRIVEFYSGNCLHVCKCKDQYGDGQERSVWRQDRAERIPWIMVALTYTNNQLRLNKERGRWNYMVAMNLIEEGGSTKREYYQVIVEPRGDGSSVKFITAYSISLTEWTDAMKLRSVATDQAKKKSKGEGK